MNKLAYKDIIEATLNLYSLVVTLSIAKSHILFTEHIYIFRVVVRTGSNYFPVLRELNLSMQFQVNFHL